MGKEAQAHTPTCPPEKSADTWQVYFSGNTWADEDNQRPGTELALHKQFTWGGQLFCIPSVYLCAEGLVADLCMQIPAEALRVFHEKWTPLLPKDGVAIDKPSAAQRQAENPFSVSVQPALTANGEALALRHSTGLSWIPFSDEGQLPECKNTLAHYGLDPAFGWKIQRFCFPWGQTPQAEPVSLAIHLKRDAVCTPGPRFSVSAPGEQVPFTHPFTGVRHTLTVQECEHRVLDTAPLADDTHEHPQQYCAITYTIVPNLPKNAFSVRDAQNGDCARRVGGASSRGACACSIGVLVKPQHAPVKFGGSEQGEVRAAASSLRFERTGPTEWFMVFQDTPVAGDITVTLL